MAEPFPTRVPRQFSGGRIVFPTDSDGQLDSQMPKMKLNPYVVLYAKINSKQIKHLNVRAKTMTLENKTQR